MIVVLAVTLVVTVALIGIVAWQMVQDAKASAVSDRWRDAHHRHDGRHDD